MSFLNQGKKTNQVTILLLQKRRKHNKLRKKGKKEKKGESFFLGLNYEMTMFSKGQCLQ